MIIILIISFILGEMCRWVNWFIIDDLYGVTRRQLPQINNRFNFCSRLTFRRRDKFGSPPPQIFPPQYRRCKVILHSDDNDHAKEVARCFDVKSRETQGKAMITQRKLRNCNIESELVHFVNNSLSPSGCRTMIYRNAKLVPQVREHPITTALWKELEARQYHQTDLKIVGRPNAVPPQMRRRRQLLISKLAT